MNKRAITTILLLLIVVFCLAQTSYWFAPMVNSGGQFGPSGTNIFRTNLVQGINVTYIKGTNGEISILGNTNYYINLLTNSDSIRLSIPGSLGSAFVITMNNLGLNIDSDNVGDTSATLSIAGYETLNADTANNRLYIANGIYTNVQIGLGTTLQVTDGIGVTLVPNGSYYGNGSGLTNLGVGVNNLTNSVATAPASGDLLAYNSTMKKWTNVTVAAAVTSSSYVTSNNFIVSGKFWTNTSTFKCQVYINFTLTDSSISGDPSLCMTNISTGDYYNATNSFTGLTVLLSQRIGFTFSPGDYFIATNKSSGSASVTVDSSYLYR